MVVSRAGPTDETTVATLASAFAEALARRDLHTAHALCTHHGRERGETPGALFADAIRHGYALAQDGAATCRQRRAAVAMRVTKAGAHERRVWLLAEEDGGWFLAGVCASARVAEAFLAGVVPADARLETLAASERGRALGLRVLEAYARHRHVSGVLGDRTLGARTVGTMLDRLVASPGATLELVAAREIRLLARGVIGFDVRRPERRGHDRVWVIVRWGDEDDFEVRLATSTMNVELLLQVT